MNGRKPWNRRGNGMSMAAAKQPTEITYSRSGDYLLPDIAITEITESLGRYGMMRKQYLHDHRGVLYSIFAMKGTLFPHCLQVENQANERLSLMMAELQAQNPPPDKTTDPMGWAAHMSSLQSQAEAAILNEIIYS